jgi:hypothetical protein
VKPPGSPGARPHESRLCQAASSFSRRLHQAPTVPEVERFAVPAGVGGGLSHSKRPALRGLQVQSPAMGSSAGVVVIDVDGVRIRCVPPHRTHHEEDAAVGAARPDGVLWDACRALWRFHLALLDVGPAPRGRRTDPDERHEQSNQVCTPEKAGPTASMLHRRGANFGL